MVPLPAYDADIAFSSRPSAEAIRILQIEDCESDVALVERMLREASFTYEFIITAVPRLTEAFSLLRQEWFHLILLDLNLLDIDGTASVSALHAEYPHIPIIVYSGAENQHLRKDALRCGARHYLVKGYESGYSLRFMIKHALRHRQP